MFLWLQKGSKQTVYLSIGAFANPTYPHTHGACLDVNVVLECLVLLRGDRGAPPGAIRRRGKGNKKNGTEGSEGSKHTFRSSRGSKLHLTHA